MENMLKEKINFLSNNYIVTEEELTESLLLEKPFVIDVDLYLAIQTVMMSLTRTSPKQILSFVNQLLVRIDIGDGFENTMYRIYHKFKKHDEENDLKYISETFGKYYLSFAILLLENIDQIEEVRLKIQ